MAAFYIVLRNFALVDLLLFGKKIDCELLLEKCVTLVFLILKDAHHRTLAPFGFTARGRNTKIHKVLADAGCRFALKEQSVNQPYDFGFLFVDDGNAVLATVIAEKLFIRHRYLTVCKTLSLTPGDILGNAPALFLGKAGHDGYQQFALAVKGVDVLFFKEHLHMMLFQLSDGNQAVYRISCKSADRLGDDEVDFACQGICHHFIETLTAFRIRAGNTLIGVNLHELPIVSLFDVLRVVINLGFITGELLITVGGNTGIGCDPSFGNGGCRQRCELILCGRNNLYCSCHCA